MRFLPRPSLSALLVALGLGLLASACTKTLTDEEQVRKVLDDGMAALEEGDVGAAGDLLADDYKDPAKRDKRTLKQIALLVLRRGPLRVVLRDVQIQVEGTAATATFDAVAVQGAAEVKEMSDLLPQNAKQMKMTVKLSKQGDAWRVTSIEGDGMRGMEL